MSQLSVSSDCTTPAQPPSRADIATTGRCSGDPASVSDSGPATSRSKERGVPASNWAIDAVEEQLALAKPPTPTAFSCSR